MTARLLRLLILCVALAPRLAHAVTAQPLSPPTLTAADLAQSLLTGGGIVVSNVQFVGDDLAAGTFTDGAASIDIPSGIVLSSGNVTGIVGPNDFDDFSTSFNTEGDADLDGLVPGFLTNDASVLEFDFVPASSVITFTYVFASEEYNEYANTSFNDVFGFFVNGTNLALLPDGVTPVSINTVNGGNPDELTPPVNPAFFVGNDCTDTPCTIDMEADGRTVVLELHASVNPGVTNHMKIAIADTQDTSLDSWVFIQAGSFTVAENCTNGIDDDGDDLIDNADPDCQVCGDGNIDPGEQCDDDNVADGDGCSSQCQLEASSTTTTTSTTTSTVTTQSPTTSTVTTTTATTQAPTTSTSTTTTVTTQAPTTTTTTTTSTSSSSSSAVPTTVTTTTGTTTTTGSPGEGCADGSREGLTDVLTYPNIAACGGTWNGHVSNGASLCEEGWDVCDPDDPSPRDVSFTAASAFAGCFAYNASQDFNGCTACTGEAGFDDMAGMGANCAYTAAGGNSCISGGRIDAACCNDAASGTACQFKPGVTTGVVCCRNGVVPTTTTVTTSTIVTTTSSSTTTSTSSTTTTTLRTCSTSAECDDGDPCNGGEFCDDGFCFAQRGVAPACTATRPVAVVTAFQGDNVALVDIRGLTVEATIPVGKAPWGVAWKPDGTRVFVTNREDRSVSVLDPVARSVVATIRVGKQPLGVAVHPFLPRAYVTSYDEGTLTVVDTTTLAVVGTIDVGQGPAGVAVHPAGGKLYVSNYIAGTVSVVDTTTEKTIATVQTPDLPLGIAVHPSGTKVYVVSLRGRMVTVIGTVSDSVLSRVRVGRRPVGVAFDAAGTRAYVTNSGDDTITVLDAASDAVIGETPVGDFPLGVAVTDTGAVWACDGDSDDVTVLRSGGDSATLAIPGGPVSMGAFIGSLPDECPAPALVCDDANPLTGDACNPGVGCNQEPVPGVRGVVQAVDAIAAIANDPNLEGDPLAQQVRGVLPALESAVAAAETGGDKATIKLAQKSLEPLLKLLGQARRDGTLGPAGAQLLDIAREVRQRLRQLARGGR